jgi:hypothetical protein
MALIDCAAADQTAAKIFYLEVPYEPQELVDRFDFSRAGDRRGGLRRIELDERNGWVGWKRDGGPRRYDR